MSDSLLPVPLRGIVPPMVTPLADRDALDTAGVERLVEHILGGGVHGLFILGTTGEAPSLSYRLRRELVTQVCQQVDGRVPVLVGITDTSFAESVRLAGYAADAGAAAVVLAPPYYYPLGQTELQGYLQDIVGELPLPVFLYNMPSHTKVTIEVDTVRRALDLPNVVGLKDSSASMIYFHKVRRLAADRPDFSLLVGPEELLAESVAGGAHGGVCGGANLFPRLFVDLYEAASAGDRERVSELHARVIHTSSTLYAIGKHPSAFMTSVKCALSCLGICDDFMGAPFGRFSAAERKCVQNYLAEVDAEPRRPVRRAPR